ncbi:MAG: GDP-mannose 4,6-dehydratase [Phycisphaerales bacterium]
MTQPQTVLVTGAAGFIGSSVSEALLARGDRVIGLDCFDTFYDPAIKRRTIESIRARPDAERFSLVEIDIRTATDVHLLFEQERIDGVIHLAARAGVRPSIAEPALYASVNIEGSINLLEAARKAGSVSSFAFASSSSVYGNNEKVPFAEDDFVGEPISPYAATKRSCELIAHTYHHLYTLPISMLRFFTVYGPRQRPDLAISKFIRLVDEGQPIPMFGNADTSRDYTYIDDIVTGVLSAYDRTPDFGFRIWNLGGNRPVRLDEMIATVADAVGKEALLDHQPAQPGDVVRTFADLSRASDELGYTPTTSFEDGVARQVAWYRQQLAERV